MTRKAILLSLSPLAFCLCMMMMSGAVLAQGSPETAETRPDENGAGQVAQSGQPTIRIIGVGSDADVETAISANAASATFGSLTLTVQVDHKYCATGGVQCTGPGLSTTAPANNNRNPVRIGIQVLQGAATVNNLTDADINVVNSFVPAGGTAVNQLGCPTCFQNAGNGTYAIFLNPVNNALWKSGSYFVQVQVRIGNRIHRALAQIEIPF
ncbi:MAG: hypothetical protein ACKVX9_15810 [Blastocatellia bacterium]